MNDVMAGDEGVDQCPRCEAPQVFNVNNEDIDPDHPGILKQTLNCKICRWEKIIRHTTREALEIEDKMARLALSMNHDDRKHGHPSNTARKTMENYKTRLIAIEQEVQLVIN